MTTIFVVEDEVLTRTGIRNNINWAENGFEYLGDAADGELALPRILELKPDIVLTDIKMPFMDGLQLAQAVHEQLPETEIVILSGYQEFDYARQALSLGVKEYILKPVSSQGILNSLLKVRQQISERADQQQTLLESKSSADNLERRKHNFLRAVLDGEYEFVSDIIKRAGELGIRLSAECYLIKIISSDVPFNALETAYIQSDDHWIGLRKNELEIVVIIKGKSASEVERQSARLNRKIESNHLFCTDCDIHFTDGDVVERLNELTISYHLAKKRSNNHFHHESENHDKDELLSNFRSFMRNLMSILMTADNKRLDEFLEAHLHLERSSFASLIYRSYVYSEFAMTLKSFCNEHGLEQPESLRGSLHIETRALYHENPEYFYNFVKTVCREVIQLRDRSKYQDKTFYANQAKKYLEECFTDPEISLVKVADAVNLSPAYLSTIFKEQLGENFVDYLIGLRIKRAKELLALTGKRTAEISQLVGYKHSSYFSVQFRKVTGLSPSEFRAQCEQDNESF
ncbi:MAG: response regulator transcription factor [Fastidiosipilaceae bacterium]|jgi:two-component system response regulator YesN